MRWTALILAGGLVLGVAASAVSAAPPDDVSAFVGRPVASIAVDLGGRPAPDEVLSLITVQSGAPLSLESVRVSVRSLVTVGRFESVEVLATDSPAGVRLVFQVVPRRPVDSVAFTGDTGLSADELTDRVRQQYGVIPSSLRPDAMVRTVTTILKDEGYLSATATARLADSPNPDRATIVADVQAGARAMIHSVRVTGSSSLSTATVEQQAGIADGAPYRRRAIDDALVKVREGLRAQQYYEAEAVVESDMASPDGTAVDLTLHVDAGPRVLGPFFTGDPPPAGRPDDLVPMKAEHSDDDDLLDDARTQIEGLLRRDGYRDASAPYTKTRTPAGLVVSFAISRGPLFRIGSVKVTGNDTLPGDVIGKLLSVNADDPFSAAKVNSGVLALDAEYIRRGYYKAVVTPSVSAGGQPGSGASLVDVAVTIVEGPRATIAAVAFDPELPHVPVRDLRAAMRSRPGDPYIIAASSTDRASIETLYHDRGFPNAHVTITPVEADEHRAITLTVGIDEGPQIFVQDIRVIGNHRVDTPAIVDAMALKAGQPLGAAGVQKSRQQVQETFGLRSVSIAEEPVFNDDKRVHVIVTVEEAPATTIAWGGGILVDRRLVVNDDGTSSQRLDIGPRGSFEITRQNLGGRNRAVDFFTRLGVRSDPNNNNEFGFVEYVLQGSYQSHRIFQTNMDLSLIARSERDVQTGFDYDKQSLTGNLAYRASSRVTVNGQYALQFTKLFNQQKQIAEQLNIGRLFPQVRLSIVSGSVLWDRRNDPLAPSRGTLASAGIELAPKVIGSEVGFVKTQMQGAVYRQLDSDRRFVVAARGELGLAHGFEQQEFLDPALQPVKDPLTGQPVFFAFLPASERFFSGGGASVRGFNQDVLGESRIITNDGLSLGGNGLVVLNLELRTRLFKIAGRDFGVVTFTDAGNVFLNASDTNLTKLRGTVGFGFRYNSPLGPIRTDFGFKLSRLPFGTSNTLEPGWTWHLSVGEAF